MVSVRWWSGRGEISRLRLRASSRGVSLVTTTTLALRCEWLLSSQSMSKGFSAARGGGS